MTQIDTDKLRDMIEKADTYPTDECVEIWIHQRAAQNVARGILERYLYDNRAAILAMADERDRLATLARANNDLARREANARRELQDENRRLREALERCAQIVERNNHRQNEKVDDVVLIARRALGSTVMDETRSEKIANNWLHRSGWEGNTDVENAVRQFAAERPDT